MNILKLSTWLGVISFIQTATHLAAGPGVVVSSKDGTNWAQQQLGSVQVLYSVAYGQGQFVAVSEGGTILTSTDGVSWIRRQSSGLEGVVLESGSVIDLAASRSTGLGLVRLSVEGPTGASYTLQASTDL